MLEEGQEEAGWPLIRCIAWRCWRDSSKVSSFIEGAGGSWLDVRLPALGAAIDAEEDMRGAAPRAFQDIRLRLISGELIATGLKDEAAPRVIIPKEAWEIAGRLGPRDTFKDDAGHVAFSEVELSADAVRDLWPQIDEGRPLELTYVDEPEYVWEGTTWRIVDAIHWILDAGAAESAADAEWKLTEALRSGVITLYGNLAGDDEGDVQPVPRIALARLRFELREDHGDIGFVAVRGGTGALAWVGLFVEGPEVKAAFPRDPLRAEGKPTPPDQGKRAPSYKEVIAAVRFMISHSQSAKWPDFGKEELAKLLTECFQGRLTRKEARDVCSEPEFSGAINSTQGQGKKNKSIRPKQLAELRQLLSAAQWRN